MKKQSSLQWGFAVLLSAVLLSLTPFFSASKAQSKLFPKSSFQEDCKRGFYVLVPTNAQILLDKEVAFSGTLDLQAIDPDKLTKFQAVRPFDSGVVYRALARPAESSAKTLQEQKCMIVGLIKDEDLPSTIARAYPFDSSRIYSVTVAAGSSQGTKLKFTEIANRNNSRTVTPYDSSNRREHAGAIPYHSSAVYRWNDRNPDSPVRVVLPEHESSQVVAENVQITKSIRISDAAARTEPRMGPQLPGKENLGASAAGGSSRVSAGREFSAKSISSLSAGLSENKETSSGVYLLIPKKE